MFFLRSSTCVFTVTLGALLAATAVAQSPRMSTSMSYGDKVLEISYGAPSVRGRQIFGPGGLLSNDPTYPIWRAGANAATSFHTDADLTIGDLNVPAGDYTLYANVEDPDHWQLIISKATGQWGLSYPEGQDLGRTAMTMSKPEESVEVYKMTLSKTAGDRGELKLEWADHAASVPIVVR